MPKLLDSIEGYIAKVRKKDTIYIGFNESYAKVFLGMEEPISQEHPFEWLDKEKTNWEKREEFKRFMAKELPDINLVDVYDYVPPTYLVWPFLGTIAINIDAGSVEERLISSRYEDEKGNPKSLDAVVYIMSYEDAKRRWEQRDEIERAEYEE